MNPAAILHASADVHGIALGDLTGPTKGGDVMLARTAFASICDDYGVTKTTIAQMLGRKHGSTASTLIVRAEFDQSKARRAQIRAVRELAQARFRKGTTQ